MQPPRPRSGPRPSHHKLHRYVGAFPWASPPGASCPFTDDWLRDASPLTPHIFRGNQTLCAACRRLIVLADTFYSAHPRVSYFKPFCWECGIGLNLHFHGAHQAGQPQVGPVALQPLRAPAEILQLQQSQARALLHDAASGVPGLAPSPKAPAAAFPPAHGLDELDQDGL